MDNETLVLDESGTVAAGGGQTLRRGPPTRVLSGRLLFFPPLSGLEELFSSVLMRRLSSCALFLSILLSYAHHNTKIACIHLPGDTAALRPVRATAAHLTYPIRPSIHSSPSIHPSLALSPSHQPQLRLDNTSLPGRGGSSTVLVPSSPPLIARDDARGRIMTSP